MVGEQGLDGGEQSSDKEDPSTRENPDIIYRNDPRPSKASLFLLTLNGQLKENYLQPVICFIYLLL